MATESSSKRPNILLITSDQQHWNTLGCLNPEISTPNLDRLAARGTLFQRAYCPNPTCTPTRASILTGQYPSQHGAYSLGTKLLEDRLTVGDVFQEHSYRTALVGKAHFQQLISTDEYPSIESHPMVRDFDYWRNFHGPWYGFERVELARNHTDESHAGQHYALWMEEKGFEWKKHFQNTWGGSIDYTEGGPVQRGQKHSWTIPEEFHYNTWIAERSNALMEEYAKNDEPFFLWSSFFDPHPSYLVPEPWASMYDPEKINVPQITPGEHDKNPPHFRMTQEEKPDFSSYREPGGNAIHGMASHLQDKDSLAKDIAVYYGMVSCMDKYIGQILDKLDELGIADNTLIVFTSDHGHYFGHHGLREKGPFHYEDGIKVPFIVSWPGQVPEGKRSEALQNLVDLPQTFLDMAGIAKPGSMTGQTQTDCWTGRKEFVRTESITENRHQPTTIHMKTLVTQRYKLTTYYNQPYGELFDLEADPGEIHNLWDDPANAELKHRLIHELLWAEMGKEPLPMPRVSPA